MSSRKRLTRRQVVKRIAAGVGAFTIAGCRTPDSNGPESVASPAESPHYPYRLPRLPYSYSALVPAIDERTMEIHHSRHHAGYARNLNIAIEPFPEFHDVPITELLTRVESLPPSVRTAIRNHGGGFWNHSLFWSMLDPAGGSPRQGSLTAAIDKKFGSFESFREQFSGAATGVFGSGWAWLVRDQEGALAVTATPNQDSPISAGLHPVLGLDVWEHAYYLRYQNRRSDYIDNFWSIVNWQTCQQYFEGAQSSR